MIYVLISQKKNIRSRIRIQSKFNLNCIQNIRKMIKDWENIGIHGTITIFLRFRNSTRSKLRPPVYWGWQIHWSGFD